MLGNGSKWGLLASYAYNNNSGASRLGFFTCILLLGLLRTSIDVLDQTLDSIDGWKERIEVLGDRLYDSLKLQGDVEELWYELAKLGLGLRCCFALVVPQLRKEEKRGDKATWGPSIDL
ncbi:hypothetical protein Tco_1198205, partial [Tanacetum coccineum]